MAEEWQYDRSVELTFDRRMERVYEDALQIAKYPANYYKRMLGNRGGVNTAHHLLGQKGTSKGFDSLVRLGHPELTVEALVLEDPFFHLFSDAELAVARERLGRRAV